MGHNKVYSIITITYVVPDMALIAEDCNKLFPRGACDAIWQKNCNLLIVYAVSVWGQK